MRLFIKILLYLSLTYLIVKSKLEVVFDFICEISINKYFLELNSNLLDSFATYHHIFFTLFEFNSFNS